MDQTIAETLAQYVSRSGFFDIPERILHKVKEVLLDSIACTVGGSQAQVGRIISRAMEKLGGQAESTLVGPGVKICAPNAAFANSMMANALDFDDTFPWAGHPGATVIPPALGVAEKTSASGKSLAVAILLAYEVCARVGIAVRPSPEGLKKIWGYGTWQTFGALVAAGKLLNLNEKELVHSFGIAGCNAPVPSLYKSALGPAGNTMVKNNYGTASHVGVLSALLAREGFEGPADIFDGEEGFWRMAGSDRCNFAALTENLHVEFKIEQIAFKPYPTVRWNHSALDGALKIAADHRLTMDEIEEIEIGSFRLAAHHPFTIAEPEDAAEAVFSTPFDIAVALSGAAPGPEWYTEERLCDSRLKNFARRVKLVEDVEANELYPAKQLAKVTVRTRRGIFAARVEYPRGEWQNPLSQSELEEKFRRLCQPLLGHEAVEGIISAVNRLEDLPEVGEITKYLQVKTEKGRRP